MGLDEQDRRARTGRASIALGTPFMATSEARDRSVAVAPGGPARLPRRALVAPARRNRLLGLLLVVIPVMAFVTAVTLVVVLHQAAIHAAPPVAVP